MTTSTQTTLQVKPGSEPLLTRRTTKAGVIYRMLSLGEPVNGLLAASVAEVKGGVTSTDTYYLRRIESQIGGVAFEVEKTGDSEPRHVLLNAPGGGHTCTCKWGSYKPNSKPCRHVELCLKAVREGKF
ncbi:MAG TPA: hypothetical protein VMG10_26545 [Gemmataceae bacterium]|nr:hypothetical protein [Gemmataceae bacterium]